MQEAGRAHAGRAEPAHERRAQKPTAAEHEGVFDGPVGEEGGLRNGTYAERAFQVGSSMRSLLTWGLQLSRARTARRVSDRAQGHDRTATLRPPRSRLQVSEARGERHEAFSGVAARVTLVAVDPKFGLAPPITP